MQARLGAVEPRQLDRGTGQIRTRRSDEQLLDGGRRDHLLDRQSIDQDVVDGPGRVLSEAERDRRIALRIDIDREASRSPPRPRTPPGSPLWSSCQHRPSGWRSRRQCPSGLTLAPQAVRWRCSRALCAERPLSAMPSGRLGPCRAAAENGAGSGRAWSGRKGAGARPSDRAGPPGHSAHRDPARRRRHLALHPRRSRGARARCHGSAGAQQRCRVLSSYRKRSHGTGGDDVVAAASGRQVLRAGVHDLDVHKPAGARRRVQEATLACGALEQGHAEPGRAMASGSPGKPAPAPRSAIARAADSSSSRATRESAR